MNKEPCAWVPGTSPLLMQRALLGLHLYLTSHMQDGTRRVGEPEINGFRVLDDRGSSGHFQVRAEGLTLAIMRRIVGPGITVTMEDV